MMTQTQSFLLQRTGRRPLRGQGVLLAEAGAPAGDFPGFNVRVFSLDDGRLAAHVTLIEAQDHAFHLHHGAIVPDIESALAFLAEYDPVADLRPPIDITGRTAVPSCWAALVSKLEEEIKAVPTIYEACLTQIRTVLARSAPAESRQRLAS